MNFFAKNIEYLREKANLTKAAMLDRLNIPRTTWASYENGTAEPNIDRILEIARFFDVTVTEILSEDISKGGGRKSRYSIATVTAQVNEPAGTYQKQCRNCDSKDAIIEAQAVTISALKSALAQAEERLKELAKKKGS